MRTRDAFSLHLQRLALLVITVFFVIPLLSACDSDSDDNNKLVTDGDQETEDSAFSATFDVETRILTLAKNNTPLLRFASDGIQLGTVDAVDEKKSYDPYPLIMNDPTYNPPKGLAWANVSAATIKQSETGKTVFDLSFDSGNKAEMTLEKAADGRFMLSLALKEGGKPVAYYRLRANVDAKEGLYGLGENFDDVNQRGHKKAVQLEAEKGVESNYNEAHVPVPIIIGTQGWGLFVENLYPAAFDVAETENTVVEATFGTGTHSDKGFVFHLFAAEHPLDITKLYYEVTGYPRLPARWALGPWIWRDELPESCPEGFCQERKALSDMNKIRELDLAVTGYWIDRPYASGVNGFDWHPNQFSDAKGMIDQAHDLGLRMAIWHTPYVSSSNESSETTKALNQYATEHGYFAPKNGMLELNKWGKLIDFTNPDAYDWWQELIKHYTDQGIEGFKLDYAEDVAVGALGIRNVWQFHDGSDERTMHATYQILYHRVYAEMLPEDGGFLLCRAGAYGDQVNGPIVWPGDLDANMAYRYEEVPDHDGEVYKAVGGLPASVVAGLSLGPSGFPFYGSDTGGYKDCPPNKETFVRWFQQTALSSVMQVGTSCNDVPWESTSDNGFDDETLTLFRDFARLHLRLWPYEWTYAENLKNDGRPIQRPLGLAHPELGVHPNDTYLFGDHLLVAPVLRPGVIERPVAFPEGRWVDWFEGTIQDGGQSVTVAAPLSKLPLYLAEGGIVPMLRPTIDTMSAVKDSAAVDSYATTPGVLYVRIFAGPESSFTLFDGAKITQKADGNTITLGSTDGSEFKYGVQFELVAFGANKPSGVKDGSAALSEAASLAALETAGSGWYFDAAKGGVLYVRVAAGTHTLQISK